MAIKAIFFDSGNVLVKEGFTPGIAKYEKQFQISKGNLYKSCHDRDYWKNFTLGRITKKEYYSKIKKDFQKKLNIELLDQYITKLFIPNLKLLEIGRASCRERV